MRCWKNGQQLNYNLLIGDNLDVSDNSYLGTSYILSFKKSLAYSIALLSVIKLPKNK